MLEDLKAKEKEELFVKIIIENKTIKESLTKTNGDLTIKEYLSKYPQLEEELIADEKILYILYKKDIFKSKGLLNFFGNIFVIVPLLILASKLLIGQKLFILEVYSLLSIVYFIILWLNTKNKYCSSIFITNKRFIFNISSKKIKIYFKDIQDFDTPYGLLKDSKIVSDNNEEYKYLDIFEKIKIYKIIGGIDVL